MSHFRKLLLFDPAAHPHSWSERMQPGEHAVLYSSVLVDDTADDSVGDSRPSSSRPAAPFCTVFATLAEARQHASQKIITHPHLRCRIYDHDGLGRPPIVELRGKDYRGESEMSARFRRWCGSILFVSGALLIALDWASDFRLSWPGTIGARALPVGLILLITELVIVYEARRKASRQHQTN